MKAKKIIAYALSIVLVLQLLTAIAYASGWYMEAIGATSLTGEAANLTGEGVTIAIIDSGIYADHPDFAGANILSVVDLTGSGKSWDTFHGTFVAGLLAAQPNNGIGIDGLVPDATILPIMITTGGNTSFAKASEAIDYAIKNGADVINLSLGGESSSEILREACARAAAAGVILVVSAGNYSSSGGHSSSRSMIPASYTSTVSVSAAGRDTSGDIVFADYSFYNDTVTVCAPGSQITSLYIDNGTVTKDGTSFAAAIVSAMAAMAKQVDSSINLSDFEKLIESSSIDMGEEGRDDEFGLGFVSFTNFTEQLLSEYGTSPEPEDPEPETSPEPEDPEPEISPEPENPEPETTPEPENPAPETTPEPENPAPEATPEPENPTPEVTPEPENPAPEASPSPENPDAIPEIPPSPFEDVPEGVWYEEAVAWAAYMKITNGTSATTFSPNAELTVAHMIQFLYNEAGRPEAEAIGDEWYAEARGWGIAEGYISADEDVTLPCSRLKVVRMMYRAAGEPAVKGQSPFEDSSDAAVIWAFENKVTNGTSPATFSPNNTLKRCEAVQFIYNRAENSARS